MADVSVDGGCHGNASLPADTAAAEAELSGRDVKMPVDVTLHSDDRHPAEIQQLAADQRSDTEDTAVLPSPDEDSEEGMYL